MILINSPPLPCIWEGYNMHQKGIVQTAKRSNARRRILMSAENGAQRWEEHSHWGLDKAPGTEIMVGGGPLFYPLCNLKLPLTLTEPGARFLSSFLSVHIFPVLQSPPPFSTFPDHFQPIEISASALRVTLSWHWGQPALSCWLFELAHLTSKGLLKDGIMSESLLWPLSWGMRRKQ